MKNLFIGPALIIIGFIIIFFGFLSSLDGNYIQTRAIVVNNVEENGSYIPILKYEVDGTTYEEKGLPEDEESILGSEVVINYNPANPNEFNIGTTINPTFFYVMGAIFILIGFYSTLMAARYFSSLPDRVRNSSLILDEMPNQFEDNSI